jgi:hypothetical protein
MITLRNSDLPCLVERPHSLLLTLFCNISQFKPLSSCCNIYRFIFVLVKINAVFAEVRSSAVQIHFMSILIDNENVEQVPISTIFLLVVT